MAYCAQSDILERLPEETLIQLTDDAEAGQVEASVVARAIADADAEIDGHLGSRHAVPLSPVPPLVRKISVELAIYHLFSRRGGAPEEWRQRYEDNRRLLENIAKGLVSLGTADPQGTPLPTAPQVTGASRVFSRRTMRGF